MLRRRRLAFVAAACSAVLLLMVAWVGVRVLQARGHSEAARADATDLQQALLRGDADAAGRHLLALQRETALARRQTNDPVWKVFGSIPILGDTARAIGDAAAAADAATHDALPPLVEAVRVAAPRSLVTPGGRIDVQRLQRTYPHFAAAASGARRARERLPHDRGSVVPPVRRVVDGVAADLDRLARATAAARRTVQAAPALLGADETRKYFVAVQNPAEARGTGGLVGAYVVVEARKGQVTVRSIGTNSTLVGASAPVVDLGADYAQLYGKDPGLWANSNMSPHFPYAARLWLAMWQRQHQERLDGAIAVDIVTLGYLVGASKPIRLSDGTVLTQRTFANFLMSGLYGRYPSPEQEDERDRLTLEIGGRAIRDVLAGPVNAPALLKALMRATSEGRLKIYSADPREQDQLEQTRVGGVIPTGDGPFLAVTFNNGGGNKLDYYLGRSIRWELGPCIGNRRESRVTITLRNGAPPAGLPSYVLGKKLQRQRASGTTPPPPGTSRLLVYLHTTAGARPTRAELDGRSLPIVRGFERGHPVYAFSVDLPPGATRTAGLAFIAPASAGSPELRLQALVRPPRSEIITADTC